MFERMIKMFDPRNMVPNQMPASYNYYPSGPPTNPMSGGMVPNSAPQVSQGTGFLSKLFGGAMPTNPGTTALGSASAGQNSMNLGQILGFVQNAQKAVQTVQTVGPIIQQYGPLVRSIPKMIQILKSNSDNNVDSETASESETTDKKPNSKESDSTTSKQDSHPQKKIPPKSAKKTRQRKVVKKQKGKSSNINETNLPKPKLYI